MFQIDINMINVAEASSPACFVVDIDFFAIKKCLKLFVEITLQSSAPCNTSFERII